MSASYATSDPRIRVENYGHENWRTLVQDEPGGDWDITGPPYPTRQAALAAVDDVLCYYFGELPTRAVLAERIEAALKLAESGSSHRLVQRMVSALKGERGPWLTPDWLHERANDPCGTPNGHPFWETVSYRPLHAWRIFERDGWWHGYDKLHNAWAHFETEDEATGFADKNTRGIDIWA